MNAVRVATERYIVIDRGAVAAITGRVRRLEQLVRDVRRAGDDDRRLLDVALVELAQSSGAKDTFAYARRWKRAHRLPAETHGLTIVVEKDGGRADRPDRHHQQPPSSLKGGRQTQE